LTGDYNSFDGKPRLQPVRTAVAALASGQIRQLMIWVIDPGNSEEGKPGSHPAMQVPVILAIALVCELCRSVGAIGEQRRTAWADDIAIC
jgi:hypothetical protein